MTRDSDKRTFQIDREVSNGINRVANETGLNKSEVVEVCLRQKLSELMDIDGMVLVAVGDRETEIVSTLAGE